MSICKKALERMTPEMAEFLNWQRSGEVAVCKDTLLMYDLIERTFTDEDVHIETELLQKYLGFQKYFPFKLLPWEIFELTLSLCTFDSSGFPRWDEIFDLLGRGAGKNGFFSYEAFCLTSKAHGIRGYDIQMIANSEEQAKRSFNDIYDVLSSNERVMKAAWEWNKESIRNKSTGSVIQYLTSGTKTKDSYRPGALFFDEVHAYESDTNIRTATSGLGKKDHPRIFKYSTDGYVRGAVIDGLKEKSQMILTGQMKDNGFLPFICRLDSDADVHEHKNWSKANPSYIYLPSLQREMKREYRDWQEYGTGGAEFMTKRMNRPISRTEDEVVPWDVVADTNSPLDESRGRIGTFGVDFASIDDFAAACITYEVNGAENSIIHGWYCKQSRDLKRIRFPIADAVAAGELTEVDDVSISEDLIVEWIVTTAAAHGVQLKLGALDDFRYSVMRNALTRAGFQPRKSGHGNIMMYRPSDVMKVAPSIIAALNRRQLKVGDNSFFRWCLNNTKRCYDSKGNITFGKIEPKSRKTDGFMAYVASKVAFEQLPKQPAQTNDYIGVISI